MGQSYRIRTELGVNKTINVDLEQDFEFLEILSLKIQQTDVYTRSCADYGVLVGRVTANNGFGIPNARISIFLPIEQVDESNPIISSIYPYKSPTDKNEDGYRYNLLPYEKSYSKHAATGTLPSRLDVLTGSTTVELYDKYYKFTSKTNESGDYMIMGVPLGSQTVVMDVDLSDIGEFSLTPQDLIRMGIATEAQVAGNQFRTSNDLNSLPQLVNLTKTIEVSPLWGDPTLCQISVNRLDFDLRDDSNIDIQPTAVFMGSMVSSTDKYRIRKNGKPRDDMGNLCGLIAGTGQILAIRQTIKQDSNGNPVLEQYQLEQAGNVIDGSGTWLTEIPMNLDYVITNEFGEKVISNDPAIGIPSKGKYRFKVKWAQSSSVNEETKRAYWLVPNVREYGWNVATSNVDPYTNGSVTQQQQVASSYYFGLDWTGYTQGFSGQAQINLLNEKINGEDTFYNFEFNRVYTVSSLISEYKKGTARGRFVGIKEIDSSDCESTVNKFPTNDGFRNFDFLYFLFAILMQIIQLLGIPLLIIFEFLAFLWNNFAAVILPLIIAFLFRQSIDSFISAALTFPALGLIVRYIIQGIVYLVLAIACVINFRKIKKYRFGRIKLPMITYPECQACECEPETTQEDGSVTAFSLLTQFSNNGLYYEGINKILTARSIGELDDPNSTDDKAVLSVMFSQSMGTRADEEANNTVYKTTKSQELRLPDTTNFVGTPKKTFAATSDLSMGERINVFNSRKRYFDGINKISVTFDVNSNNGINHFDNTLTVLMNQKLESGTLYTFVDPLTTSDVNYTYTAQTSSGLIETGISGVTKQVGAGLITIEYANPTNQTVNLSQTYFISTGSTEINYKFPSDREYYQVITAITISEAAKLWNTSNQNSLPGALIGGTSILWNIKDALGWQHSKNILLYTSEVFTDFQNQYITIVQRGVDPYSPMYTNGYGIGKILGLPNENDFYVTANTRLNIPIQKITSGIATQEFTSQSNIFYPSYFFEAGNGFTGFSTSSVGYYGRFDANFQAYGSNFFNVYWNGLRGKVSTSGNDCWNGLTYATRYDSAEDLSGVGMLFMRVDWKPSLTYGQYYSPSLINSLTANPMSITSKVKNVMRTDRLPSSDYMDGSGWNSNAAVLQENLGFAIYNINTDTEDFTSQKFATGAQVVTADIEGQPYVEQVVQSLSTCENMVGLDCYSGSSGTFGITAGCKQSDSIENGCYILMDKPLVNLKKDINAFEEWAYRFRFFYGLCRGVLAQSFVNNWVNGIVYSFPIQVVVYFDKKNKPLPPQFATQVVYFDSVSNNFYYRSSPYYSGETMPFLGGPPSAGSVNDRELKYPTTIINLGIKDSFYQEIIFDPSARAYIMRTLNPTSYSDTSDLVNLFVISRIANSSFLQQLGIAKDTGLNKLFSRPELRIDGDLAQTMSINSEYGVVPFSPDYYPTDGTINSPVAVYGGGGNPTIGIFFSSSTQNLQDKDFITPGIIDFRPDAEPNAITYPYGIYSQLVPFYRWGYNGNSTGTIFGDQYNSWKTGKSNIIAKNYQSLDRRAIPGNNDYFIGPNGGLGDIYERGYIFNVTGTTPGNGGYSSTVQGIPYKSFLVGAPFHFYFGLIKGESALDKFKTKYSVDE
jgi:hypothetical protein